MSKKYSILKTGLTVLLATLMVGAVVNATTTVGDNVSVGGTLGVTGASTLSSTLAVTGASTLTGALAANGGITVDTSNFTVNGTTGAVATASTLDVTGAITFSSTFKNTAIPMATTATRPLDFQSAPTDTSYLNKELAYFRADLDVTKNETVAGEDGFTVGMFRGYVGASQGGIIVEGLRAGVNLDDTSVIVSDGAGAGYIAGARITTYVPATSNAKTAKGLIVAPRDISALAAISGSQYIGEQIYLMQTVAKSESWGLDIYTENGSADLDAAISIRNGGSEKYTYGIDMNGATTIGTADIRLSNGATIANGSADAMTITEPTITLAGATKINLDGPVDLTGALNLDGPATGGLTTPLFGIGVYDTPKLFTPATVGNIEIMPFQVNISSGTDASVATDSLMGGYFGVTNTADMTNRQLQGVLSSVTMAKDAFAAYGVQGHVLVSPAAQAPSGNIAGVSGKVTISDSLVTGIPSAGLFTFHSAGGGAYTAPTNSYGVWVDITGGTVGVKSVFEGSAGSGGTINGLHLTGTLTNGINMSGASITNDITLSTGAVIKTGSSTGPSADVACVTLGSLYLSTGAGGKTFHCTVVGAAGAATWEDLK